MWAKRFYNFYMSANETSSAASLHCFLTSVSDWEVGFCPHGVHGSMLKGHSCVCGCMLSLFFSPQETKQHRLSASILVHKPMETIQHTAH